MAVARTLRLAVAARKELEVDVATGQELGEIALQVIRVQHNVIQIVKQNAWLDLLVVPIVSWQFNVVPSMEQLQNVLKILVCKQSLIKKL